MRAAYHEKEVQFNPIKDNQRPTASARATEKETHTRRHVDVASAIVVAPALALDFSRAGRLP